MYFVISKLTMLSVQQQGNLLFYTHISHSTYLLFFFSISRTITLPKSVIRVMSSRMATRQDLANDLVSTPLSTDALAPMCVIKLL